MQKPHWAGVEFLPVQSTLLQSLCSVLATSLDRGKTWFSWPSSCLPLASGILLWQSCLAVWWHFSQFWLTHLPLTHLCAHRQGIAVYPLQGVAGLCLMGPGFCISFLRPLHASQTLCRLREKKSSEEQRDRQQSLPLNYNKEHAIKHVCSWLMDNAEQLAINWHPNGTGYRGSCKNKLYHLLVKNKSKTKQNTKTFLKLFSKLKSSNVLGLCVKVLVNTHIHSIHLPGNTVRKYKD